MTVVCCVTGITFLRSLPPSRGERLRKEEMPTSAASKLTKRRSTLDHPRYTKRFRGIKGWRRPKDELLGVGHEKKRLPPSTSQEAINRLGKHNSSFIDGLKPFIKNMFGMAVPGQKYVHPDIKGFRRTQNGLPHPILEPKEERFCREGLPRHLCSYVMGKTEDCIGPEHKVWARLYDF